MMSTYRDEEWLKKFGQNLQSIREKKGLSLRKLADEADINFTQVHRIEKGETSPSVSLVKAIADALGIKMGKLFDF
jgi:transcriptional regulator with XRE-family HTH domain